VQARALLALKRPADAEPMVWRLYLKDPQKLGDVSLLIATLIDVEEYGRALEVARKATDVENKLGHHPEFVGALKEIVDHHSPGTEFLEYMVGMYNSANREHDYCDALVRLFELYYAAGNFLKAGDSLDAAAEVDPYEQGHQKRLEMLKGKIDGNRYRAI